MLSNRSRIRHRRLLWLIYPAGFCIVIVVVAYQISSVTPCGLFEVRRAAKVNRSGATPSLG